MLLLMKLHNNRLNQMLRFKHFLIREAISDTPVTHDLTYMRANPFHIGHQTVVNQVMNSAAQNGGGHSIILSRTQDPKKNPLSPEQKLYWAQKSFPGANIQLATPQTPTLLHHLSNLHDQGVTDVHIHVGSDRVDEFRKLAQMYNGQKNPDGSPMRHGYYNFNSINVHPVGATRDDNDSSNVAGASATAMRNAAENNDRKTFHAMAPEALTPPEKDQMMSDVRTGMNPPAVEKIPKTNKPK